MLVPIINGGGAEVNVLMPGQETIVDRSGVITTDDTAQELMAENESRSGYWVQNCSGNGNVMWINELGDDATTDSPSIKLVDGGIWSSANYPLTVNAISIIGTADDKFTAREW